MENQQSQPLLQFHENLPSAPVRSYRRLFISGAGVALVLTAVVFMVIIGTNKPITQKKELVIKNIAVPTEEGSCSWVPEANAISYHYQVVNLSTSAVVQESDVPASLTKITFKAQKNVTYSCLVDAVKACAQK